MALVYNNINDFVLRDQPFLDMSDEQQGRTYTHFPYSMENEIPFDYSNSAYMSFRPPMPYNTTMSYQDPPHLVVDAPNDMTKSVQQRYTPSASPSMSMAHSLDHTYTSLSTSCPSIKSTASSTVSSPYSHATHSIPGQDQWIDTNALGIANGFKTEDSYSHDSYSIPGMEGDQILFENSTFPDPFVDPSLIQPFDAPSMHSTTPHANMMYPFHPQSHPLLFQPPSPAPSDASSHDSRRPGSGRFKTGISSPYLRSSQYHPYPQTTQGRRMSISSSHSRYSQDSPRSLSLGYDDEGRERDRCPNPDCGKTFKDLKAHMLTHQSERPEKCPIQTCEYHQKGFARKYDKQRHTLTHYKGTMVCGFCPGSGSAAEKSFNRADVFKRHLTSVHGVEQAPPNSRKKSPSTNPTKKTNYNGDVTGKCSTCSATFNNAQDFYEHLDECVLRVVQQEEPSEAINAQNLEKLKSDEAFQETLERHMLSSELDMSNQNAAYDEEDDEEDEEDALDDDGHESWTATANGNGRSGKGTIKSIKRDLS